LKNAGRGVYFGRLALFQINEQGVHLIIPTTHYSDNLLFRQQL